MAVKPHGPRFLSELFLAALLILLSATASSQANRTASVLLQAQSALDQNHPETAIDLLSGHLKAHTTDDKARLLLAEALVMADRAPAAEEQYRAILKHAPANYIALAGLGELYASTGRVEQAEPLLACAIKYGPHEPQLRIEWAQVLARLHRFKQASAALTGVTAPASGEDRIAYFRLKAAIAEGLGKSAEAAAAMERALEVRPEDPTLQLAAAVAQLHAGKPDRTATLAGSAFSRTQDPDSGLLLLQAQLAMDADVRETLASLRALQPAADREASWRQRVAEILIRHGDYAEAVADLKRTAELDPDSPDILFNLALAQFKAGAAKDALATGEKCKVLRDSADLESLLGDIQEALGDSLAAVKSYQLAATMDPRNENYQLAVAVELIRHHNFQPAKLVLDKAAQSFPNSWRLQLALGMVEYFAGSRTAASQILLRAIDLAPQPEAAFPYLSDIELDETAPPDPPAIARICGYANAHPRADREQFYCGALMLRADYASRDVSRLPEIIRRLSAAEQALPGDAAPHCELGRAYSWIENWKPAQAQYEMCVKLNPDSTQAHYRLARIYQHNGQAERAQEEMKLYKDASERMAEENEQRQNALKTFLYTMQNQAAGTK